MAAHGHSSRRLGCVLVCAAACLTSAWLGAPLAAAETVAAPENAVAAKATSALRWEVTRRLLVVRPDAGEVIGEFPVENTGAATVRFKEIVSSCGCTRAEAEPLELPPGARGVVRGVFTIGQREGMNLSTLSIETDEPGAPETTLRLDVDIRPWLRLEPRFLIWRKGDPVAARRIAVSVAPEVEVESASLLVSPGDDAAFKARVVKTDVPGSPPSWAIEAEPRSTAVSAQRKLEIVLRARDGSEHRATGHALVP